MKTCALVLAALLLAVSPARGQGVRAGKAAAAPRSSAPLPAATDSAALEVLEVVELAGDLAYLTPGIERHYVIEGDVHIGRRRYRVLAHNTKSVVIALAGHHLVKGQRATVQAQ